MAGCDAVDGSQREAGVESEELQTARESEELQTARESEYRTIVIVMIGRGPILTRSVVPPADAKEAYSFACCGAAIPVTSIAGAGAGSVTTGHRSTR